ncbi:hypothetical protein GIB67_021559 [Kingdonia uniflora]|uniref:Isopropylmalate dehydrogenase-like domain-containing protein n=1 Tax=Kingdonia uniflora TaxID=39325 RepID=A0A7J7L9W6_9MAGN|nr:hypothetical protein GIB67_021559 [Kingdonia uniflora]
MEDGVEGLLEKRESVYIHRRRIKDGMEVFRVLKVSNIDFRRLLVGYRWYTRNELAPLFLDAFKDRLFTTWVGSCVEHSPMSSAMSLLGFALSLSCMLGKELDLYASLVNCCNLPGLPTRRKNVDIVVIRENTEDITKLCSKRIAQYAFEYIYLNNIKTVTAMHKANIMKLVYGLFLESCREIATKYPGITYNEIIVDNCRMQLVSKPEQFNIMV